MQPLTYGSILIVGAKASNFDDEIKRNPRVAMWDSEQQHWRNNVGSLPVNTRAVFFTRWVGHADFVNIVKEARKKRITIFTPAGTGVIARNVKELLGLVKKEPEPVITSPNHNHVDIVTEKKPMNTQVKTRGKLTPLAEFIDQNLSAKNNASILLTKANELGITTTQRSLANFVNNQRKKGHPYEGPKVVTKSVAETTLDVSVQILDNAIKELKDVREFLLATVKENRALRTKIERFKKFIED